MTKINLLERIKKEENNPSIFDTLRNKKNVIATTLFIYGLTSFLGCATTVKAQDNINTIKGDNHSIDISDYPTSGTPTNDYTGMSWNQIKEQLDNPEKVFDYVTNNVKFQKEPSGRVNHTQTPEETLENGGWGDCEDIAYIVVDALEHHGYKTKILSVHTQQYEGHAVGIYQDPKTEKWHYIGGNNYRDITIEISKPYNDINEMSRDIARKMRGTLRDKYVETPNEYIKNVDEKGIINH